MALSVISVVLVLHCCLSNSLAEQISSKFFEFICFSSRTWKENDKWRKIILIYLLLIKSFEPQNINEPNAERTDLIL